jgi:hypothetical protein
MTQSPVRMLEMRLEAYAEIAVDGGIWLAGEILAHGLRPLELFAPDPAYMYKSRHRTAVMRGLSELDEARRHCIFTQGFLALPDNGAQTTFRRLPITHTEMLDEALHAEWSRRDGRVQENEDVPCRAIDVASSCFPSRPLLARLEFVSAKERPNGT